VTSFVVAAVSLVTLLNFRLLGGSRLVPIIRSAALQGALLVLVGVLLRGAHEFEPGYTVLALASATIKGFALPALLLRAMRQVEIRREVEPLVGYNLSLLIGAAGLGVAAALGPRIGATPATSAPLLVTVSLFTMWTGLFLIVARRKAVTQVLGYLVFENGIYGFGIAVASEAPLLVEMGVLLDLLVAVFVMGIIIFHIQRDFSHIDVDRLALLRRAEEPAAAGDER
jgi:hydrogenase-4 component E